MHDATDQVLNLLQRIIVDEAHLLARFASVRSGWEEEQPFLLQYLARN